MIAKNIDGQNISQAFIDQIKSDSPDVIARLVVDGEPLECSIVSVTVSKGSCGSNAFSIGNVIGDSLKATVKDLATAVKGKVIDYQIGANIGAEYEYISLGLFTVSEAKKTRYTTEITAYSSIVSGTVDKFKYDNLVTYTIAEITAELAAQMGVTITIDSGIDTSQVISPLPLDATYYQILEAITVACGGYAINTNEGDILIKSFNAEITLNVNTGMSTSLPVIEEEPFTIDSVYCSVGTAGRNGDGGEVRPSFFSTVRGILKARDGGTDKKIITEEGKPIMVDTATLRTALSFECSFMTKEMFRANIIKILGYEYYPANVHLTLGDPRLEGMDVLGVLELDGNTYNVPCHAITHIYNGAFNTDVVAVKSTAVDRGLGTSLPITDKINQVEELATTASIIAGDTNQYFWFTPEGTDTGGHITEVPKADFLNNPRGGNLLARSNGVAIRDGMAELAIMSRDGVVLTDGVDTVASFTPSKATIGKETAKNVVVDANGMAVKDDDTDLASFTPSKIELGANSVGSTVEMCGGVGKISAGTGTETYGTYSKLDIGVDKVLTGTTGKLTRVRAETDTAQAQTDLYAYNDDLARSGTETHTTRAHAYTDIISLTDSAGGLGEIRHVVSTGGGSASLSLRAGTNTSANPSKAEFYAITQLTSPVALTVVSDKRLKEHIDYLDEDACEFIRNLKPAKYKKDDQVHTGFYAQEVKKANNLGTDITPKLQMRSLDGDIREKGDEYYGLSYEDLIAPLVRYCQMLEKRIEKLEGGK